MKLAYANERDIDFVVYRGPGPGGQNRNKVANCVRATHRPSGIVVRETRRRSMPKNKQAAIEEIDRRLRGLADQRRAQAKQDRWGDKPDAGFGAGYVRTLRLVGSGQGMVDHASGVAVATEFPTPAQLDTLIMSRIRAAHKD